MITDAHVIQFANEYVRVSADILSATANTLRRLSSLAASKNIVALMGADTTQVIDDGSQTDGRTAITVGDVQILLSIAQLLTSLAEANTVLLYQGVGTSISNMTSTTNLRTTIEKIAVNGQGLF